MKDDYLKTSKKLINHDRLNFCLSSNYDEACLKFFPKFSHNKIYDLLSNYPEEGYEYLVKNLKSRFDIKNVILTTGCEDFILRLSTVIKNRKWQVGIILPTFYRITDTIKNCTLMSWKDIKKIKYLGLDIIFIINPNPLNGQVIKKEILGNIIKNNSKTIFVIDETAMLFLSNWQKVSFFSEVRKYKNVLVISSLSKFFGLSGLRIGFGSGSKKLLEYLDIPQTTFPITGISNYVANEILTNDTYIEHIRKRIMRNKSNIETILLKNPEIGVIRSETNCIYCYSKNNSNIYKKLLQFGIVGLNLDTQKGIEKKGIVRLTIYGSSKKNKFLIEKLKLFNRYIYEKNI